MSFKAKLCIEGEERNLLDAELVFSQLADYNGRPSQLPVGAPLNLTFESTRNDALFYSYMFHPDRMFKGYIRFFKRDGLQKYFDIEFANAHIIRLHERFSSTGETPMYIGLTISYGISRIRDVIHEKKWNPSNPFAINNNQVTEQEEELEPLLLDYHIEDLNNNKIEETIIKENQEIYLVINSQNTDGQVADIDLENKSIDFEYKGKWMKDDIISDIVLNDTLTKVKLKAVKQKNN